MAESGETGDISGAHDTEDELESEGVSSRSMSRDSRSNSVEMTPMTSESDATLYLIG